jgi:hypothetical protein
VKKSKVCQTKYHQLKISIWKRLLTNVTSLFYLILLQLPTYHRLDIQANYKTTMWGNKTEWTFALLNATGSENISGYYYAPDGTETLTDYKIEGEEGMEPFPSIGVKIQF